MRGFKKCISAVLAAALVLTALPVNGSSQVYAAGATPDATVKALPEKSSPFNDTNGDGLGEFEGWGTSLCWWANRLGGDDTMAQAAATAFFDKEEGLGLNIGRYNIGGGDKTGDIPLVSPNDAAQIYGLEGETAPQYGGTSMEITTNSKLKNATYAFSDADFGFMKGKNVGEFKEIGYVNEIGAANGSGGNLTYTVNVQTAGKYTIKMLCTLNGNNRRAMAIRLNEDIDSQNAANDKVAGAEDINANEIATASSEHLFLITFRDVDLKAGDNRIAIGGKGGTVANSETWGLNFAKMLVVESSKEGVLPEDDPFLHPSHIKRSDSDMPGYWKDVTKIQITEDKPLIWWKANYARADEDCGYAWNYDWNKDANQRNVLTRAKAASGDEFIAEAFSNSPPYFMLNSGCTSGAIDSNKDNLRTDSYNAFAAYMADVIEHYAEAGIVDFTSTTAMNEPYTNYWGAYSLKQEGCHFDQGNSESKIIVAFKKELEEKAAAATNANVKAVLNNIILSGTDETSIDTAITSYNKLSSEAKKAIKRIDTHTYSGSKRAELSELAQEAGKNLWMSEIDGDSTAGTDAEEMSAGLGFARQIIKDVNGLKCSAWIMWNAVDVNVDKNNPFDTDTVEGLKTRHIDDDPDKGFLYNPEEGSYWGIAIGNHNEHELILTRKYYAYGQFSKYIRPGYTIMGTSDTADTLIAYDPKGGKAVIVAVNTAGGDKTWKFDLSRFETMGSKITAYRTSGPSETGEAWADVSSAVNAVADTSNKSFTATLKANSITTYIVEGVTFDKAKDDERTERAEDLKKIQKEIMSGMDLSDLDLANLEITLTESMVSGSQPYNNSATNVVKNVIDNNFTTFFDGVSNGYVQIDLGAGNAKAISAYGYAPRYVNNDSQYLKRCVGASLYGSNDGANWDLLHTITETPEGGKLNYAYMNAFDSAEVMGKAYRYYKYAVDSTGDCNIAELKLYELPASVEIPELPNTLEKWVTYCESKTTGKNYSKDTKAAYDSALAAAKGLSASTDTESRESAQYALFDAYLKLKEVYKYATFSGVKGDAIYDNNGELIQAHGGQIQKVTYDNGYDFDGNGTIAADEKEFWYWVGEDKTNDYRPCPGVRAYISQDLFNWIDLGDVLKTVDNWETFTTDKYFTDLYGDLPEEQKKTAYADIWTADGDTNSGCVIERPKMIYNDKTNQYVIWFHADGQTPDSTGGNYAKAKAGVAVSDSPFGPFKMQGSYLLNHKDGLEMGFDAEDGKSGTVGVGGHVRDMNLFKDDDGTGYVIYSSDGNRDMYISKLNDTFTNIVKTDEQGAVEGIDFSVNFVGESREAPAMFKYKNKYYLVTSGCTGWGPNQAKYAVADDPLGPWTMVGDPCTGENANTTYFTQSTCVFPVDAASGKFIYMGDRWYNPEVTVGPGAGGSLRNSRYVWLPVEFTADGEIALGSYSDWDMSTFNGIEPYELETELPATAKSVAELKKVLPNELKIKLASDTAETTATVTWGNLPAEKTLGEVSVSGTMKYTKEGEEYTRTIKHKATLWNENIIYFFDCASNGSSYLDLLSSKLGNKLRNKASDQKYSEENHAGYTGRNGGEGIAGDDTNYEMGVKTEGTDMWSQGYWATKGNSIDYKFTLEAGRYTVATGFYEWWNATRGMNITVKSNDETIATSGAFEAARTTNLQKNVNFTLEENAEVTVSVAGTTSAAPILSWIAMMRNPTPQEYLQASVAEIAISKADESKYEKDAMWDYYEEVLSNIEALAQDEKLTQKKAEAAIQELRETIALLTPKKNTKPPVKKNQVISVKASFPKTYGDKAFSLGAKVKTGDGTLSYKSSATKVATVDKKTGKVTIKGTGSCTITVTASATAKYNKKTAKVTLTVKPKKAAVKTLKPGKKQLKVTWKKDAQATGYEVQCCLNKKFKSGVKTATIKKAKTTNTTFKGLKKGKKYYVRIRAYKTAKVNNKSTKLTGAWSKVMQSKKIK